MRRVIGKVDCVIKALSQKQATFVKGNRCKISVPRAQHKFIMYFGRRVVAEDLLGNVQSCGLYPV